MRLVIIAYHHITERQSSVDSRLYMDVARFERQLSYLAASGVPVIAFAPQIDAGRQQEETTVMLTFDDAYENFYTLAYPLLRKYNLPAVLFVPTSKVGLRVFEVDYGYLQTYVNKAQLEEMNSSKLVNIQPHGHSHIRLGEQPIAVQREEIALSIDYVQREFGLASDFFCLPYGSHNADTYKILGELQCPYVFTTNSGDNYLPASDALPIALSRFAFGPSIRLADYRQVLELPGTA
jgi:peptidoglycan/xylan/chitin deacetylase (PgdA/CDA1 family)